MSNKIKNNKFSDVPLRVKSWVYIIIIFFAGSVNIYTMALFTTLLSYQGNREFFYMLYPKLKINLPLVIISFGQFFALIFTSLKFFVPVTLFIIPCFLACIFYKKDIVNSSFFLLFIGIIISIISFSYLFYIRFVTYPFDQNIGLKLLIYIVFLTEFNDVFQYLSGKFFGKNAIVPKISPNKTVEGLIGAIFLSIGLSNLLGFLLFPFYKVFVFTILGILFSILGFLGDVFMSYIKRYSSVKDSGRLIPGHGGLLDRMDSLFFNAPLFYLITNHII